MAKFLIVSALAETVGVAIRLMAEGHEVRYYIHSKEEGDVGDGFLQKVKDWREHLDWADLVFFDDVRQRGEGESTYDAGKWFLEVREQYPDKLLIGGPPDVGRLENDRLFGQQVMADHGIPVVPMHRFTSFEEGRSFVQEHGGGWALKWNSQVPRDLAHVSFDPEDMLEFLSWVEENWGELAAGQKVDFVLQEAVKGIELAVTVFFDGQRFHGEACYINQEEKKLLDGGLGPTTGQTGEIGVMIPNARLYQETLAKVEPFLAEQGYVGFADINCIVAGPDKVVPLEFTIGRPGYPTIYSWCEVLGEPVGEFLLRMAAGDDRPIRYHPAVDCTVVLATGSFPEANPTRNRVSVLHGLEKTGLRHVWLCEVRFQDGRIYGAGDMGYLAVITGKGDGIQEAVQNAYATIEQLSVTPYEKYRLDIGERALREFPQLASWGWLR